ncbi:hypothetical protein FNF29_04405 [Cafeteria roenbergensis]|uniref:Phosphodiesterase n=1 Tax=Cafeteria roenbergensis TaxID=33653 RepID=A0A5A8CHX5_CAFRO|nr:hypothetical protein FNF29_04405 [Cafeteria roenbergensis]|eukprot:KAA0151720.1 hypothetical protein FNF29_04405 [Cafeteria roenbergensis]
MRAGFAQQPGAKADGRRRAGMAAPGGGTQVSPRAGRGTASSMYGVGQSGGAREGAADSLRLGRHFSQEAGAPGRSPAYKWQAALAGVVKQLWHETACLRRESDGGNMSIHRVPGDWAGVEGTCGEVVRPIEALARPKEVAARVHDLLDLNHRYSLFIDTFESILSQPSTHGVLEAVTQATEQVLGLEPGGASSARAVVSASEESPSAPAVGQGTVPMSMAQELLTFRMRNLSELAEMEDAIGPARTVSRHLKYDGGAAAKAYTIERESGAGAKSSPGMISRSLGSGGGSDSETRAAAASSAGAASATDDSPAAGSGAPEARAGTALTATTSRSGAADPGDWALPDATGLAAIQCQVIVAAANQKRTAVASSETATDLDTSHGHSRLHIPTARSDPADATGISLEAKAGEREVRPAPVRAALAAPILDSDASRMYGVLEIHSDDPDKFVASDKHLLEAFASTAARCIRGVGLLVATRTAVQRSTKLLSMTRHALSEDDLGNVVKRIVETGYDLIPADRVSVFLVDREAEELVLIVSEDAAGYHMPIGAGIAGAVATSGQVENVADAYTDVRFNQSFDKQTNYRTRSVLAVPVHKAKGDVIAVIQAINRTDGEPFNAEDEAMLRAVANAAAVALTQARLLKDAHAETDKALALVEAGSIIEQAERRSSDLYQMLNDLVSKVASRLVPSDKMTLFLVDEIKGELVFRLTKDEGEGLKDLRIPIGFGIAGAVAKTGRVENIPEAYEDKRFTKEVDRKTGYRTRSVLVVPIVDPSTKRVVAVLQAINKRGGGRFTRTDEKIFQAFASNIASSISKRVMQAAYDRVMGDPAEELQRSLLSQFLNRSESTAAPAPPAAGQAALGTASTAGSTKSRARRRSVAWGRAKGGPGSAERPGGILQPVSIPKGQSLSSAIGAASPLPAGAGSGRGLSPDRASSRTLPATPPGSPRFAGEPKSASAAVAAAAAGSSQLKRTQSSDLIQAAAAGALGEGAELEAKGVIAAEGDWPGSLIGGAILKSAPLSLPEGPVPFRGAWPPRMVEFSFNTLAESHEDLCRCVLDMCYDLGLVQFFHLDSRKILRFMNELSVRYRDNPYHTFEHGVSVAHVAFVVASRCPAASRLMSEVDRLALILGCAAHDVEHPGWNNAFEVATMSPLAIRYNDQSVLENHHAATMFRILDVDGTDVLSDLPQQLFVRFRKVALRGILATDMAHHGKLVERARELTPDLDASFPGDEVTKACTLAEFVFHTADICNSALPAFEVVRDWAVRVCQEFTNQAALEVEHGMVPLPHMLGLDDEHVLAKSQVFFAGSIVRPLYAAVVVALPQIRETVDNIDRNVQRWKEVVAETAPKPAAS